MRKLTLAEFNELGGIDGKTYDGFGYTGYSHYVDIVMRKMNLPVQRSSKIVLNPCYAVDPAQEFILDIDNYPFVMPKYYCQIGGRLNDNERMRVFLKLEKFNEDGNLHCLLAEKSKSLRDQIPVFDSRLTAIEIEDIATLKKYLSLATKTPESKFYISIEDPITQVTVHQMSDFPVYFFNAEGVRHLVNIETSSKRPNKYIIRISTNANNTFTLESKSTGTKYRTVLLKRLNDWFKATYGKRAVFSWGDPVAVE